VISRFGGAGEPGWTVPADDELREHFTSDYLSPEITGLLVAMFTRRAARLREELVVTFDDPLFGPVLPCSGNRGTASRGRHGDYAALGQLIADVTGSDYAEAVAGLVLGPLGMTGSTFPPSWPHDDPDAVTGYELEPDGTFVPDLDDVAAIPAAAGLWTTAADLVRFCTGWSSLLPGDLAGEALRPQAAEADGPGQAGLGWRLNTARGFAYEVGNGPGGSSSLIVKAGDGRAYVALTNRKAPQVAALNIRVFLNGS
jgi:CubicO group peptidase (beta-lactamase class C family)